MNPVDPDGEPVYGCFPISLVLSQSLRFAAKEAENNDHQSAP